MANVEIEDPEIVEVPTAFNLIEDEDQSAIKAVETLRKARPELFHQTLEEGVNRIAVELLKKDQLESSEGDRLRNKRLNRLAILSRLVGLTYVDAISGKLNYVDLAVKAKANLGTLRDSKPEFYNLIALNILLSEYSDKEMFEKFGLPAEVKTLSIKRPMVDRLVDKVKSL